MKSMKWHKRLYSLGVAPGDDEKTTLQKQIYFSMTSIGVLVGLVLGLFQISLELYPAAYLPFFLMASFLLSLLAQVTTKNFKLYMYIDFIVLLTCPMLNQWALGGFGPAGGIMFWGISAPFGALLFLDIREARPLFILYFIFSFASICMDRFYPPPESWARTPPWLTFYMLLFNAVGFGVVVYMNIRHFAKGKNEAMDALDQEHRLLKQEREKSERLLLNILPEPIADRLKRNDNFIADGFSQVTILFADIVNFTPLSARISPQRLVSLLNAIFSRFDELAETYGLEKIKTIGDAYMAACGLPLPVEDHARRCADMALAMQEAAANFENADIGSLQLRIGMNTGPVVAGVIGVRKFNYDLWGDAVNTASRMESQGQANTIQVTEDTFLLLKDEYEFEERGLQQIKGKGEIRTFILKGRQAPVSKRTASA